VGAFERVRLQLPAVPGVRPIEPPVPYGQAEFRVEALRPLEQVRAWPMQPGDLAWVGVRRIHALAYPGFRFLIVTDGSPPARAAVAIGGQMARLAHARVTLLGTNLTGETEPAHLQAAREALGSGLAALDIRALPDPTAEAVRLEVERLAPDLVLLAGGTSGRAAGLALAEQALAAGLHHVLIASPAANDRPLTRALICVTGSEPGKQDVLLAGPLLQALGAEATLLSVLPEAQPDEASRVRAQAFLADGQRTLSTLNIPVSTAVRTGPVATAIAAERQAGGHDLLVLGAPLPDRAGRVWLGGVVRQVLAAVPDCPVLIVRSAYATPKPAVTREGRINIVEEIVT
jgi:sulfate transport system ATP-binding protein